MTAAFCTQSGPMRPEPLREGCWVFLDEFGNQQLMVTHGDAGEPLEREFFRAFDTTLGDIDDWVTEKHREAELVEVLWRL